MSGLGSDPVFGALTRPQMVAGVTYSFAIFNMIVTVEAFLISKSFWSLLIAPVLHVVGYLGCLREPRFFDLWITKVSRCPRVRNHAFWRANSYRP
ncbi:MULTISPECIES: type IV secretion system protein VirB3 [unclassified Caulobacter]|jgi:type IV secretion system protein VirB3|uniref:type IV secretion system protein VirB3 n=1 Tax=unclassified Caulobacter TaxID=2648921 RepID=UPI001439EE52|nr:MULTISPECIES: type IV secretion system protein VirB3 [unclassified Caulobacter]MBQ1563169.1 type IV secretion system protein VirB3 [Caulobacter sp.]